MIIPYLPVSDYTDYGPNPYAPARADKATTEQRNRWAMRPQCEYCGTFRGRYLRDEWSRGECQGYVCRGCDNEDAN